jgi:hypothetical protein
MKRTTNAAPRLMNNSVAGARKRVDAGAPTDGSRTGIENYARCRRMKSPSENTWAESECALSTAE